MNKSHTKTRRHEGKKNRKNFSLPFLRVFVSSCEIFILAVGLSATSVAAPQRIVSLCVPGDQLLLSLVPRERIVALSQYAVDPDLSANYQQAEGIPRVRGGAESLVTLQPDLVLTSVYSNPMVTAYLTKRGVKVVALDIPTNFDELRDQIRNVARIVGEEEKAETLIRDMDVRLEKLRAHRLPKAEWPAIFICFQDRFSMGSHASFTDALLEAVGCRNIANQLAKSGAIPLETVLFARPDMVIFTRYKVSHPTSTQMNHLPAFFRRIGSEVASVSMRDIVSPDPSSLNFAEWLQEKVLQIAEKKRQASSK